MIPTSTIEAWLREDLGHHDVTNDVPGETEGRLVATERGVAAGIEAATQVFEYLGVESSTAVGAGDRVDAGDVVFRTEGPARETLRGERVAVNVAAHASGIATRTRTALEAARRVSEDVAVAGTRKTTPGLRGVEKRAVAAGGGDTHRLDCSHMVMIKDNHVAELGIERAVERFRERASFATRIEVEAETEAEALAAAEAGADVVLLDNMMPAETAATVEVLPEGVVTEASGGITIESLPEYAATGVDVVSLGSLTHSADALDLSFRIGE
ncbi:nicotinate-nucleotide pyrophosphorylase (carboxylating) [Natronomonas moolapensis 8.8.11]|uniref:Nicotinate-nucleotide pyrophosphorylase [carboxylating] n=1 Tax=Natronomonas moolapensis (strain DSM 18674 / CECT 7526 / JCM 14361 / 8.8.11) TaxID=268739 RepID=M1XQX3_NATM8|nr:carboxylating nicotinate-nucleotide diphosphorylase [Natronomonas moolapensis]CCQ36577.1 nicotinate-nucleotide pyrophosphorylase (carboxylating) [Natronomonas moolapensis 8.8.11]